MIPESKVNPEEFIFATAMATYSSSLEHLLEELSRIDLIINLHLGKWKAEHSRGADDYLGLYISENEVNSFLQTPPCELKVDIRHEPGFERIETITHEINRKKAEIINQGKELRLHILSELFHLQPIEIDALLICLAPELDLRYEKLYSYLQDDVTKKRPCVDLVINLLCSSLEERLMARGYFSQTASLIRNRLIYLIGDSQLPLLSKSIKVDERIIGFLLGDNEIDYNIRSFSEIIEPVRSFNDLILLDETKNVRSKIINRQSSTKIPMLFLHGPYGTGKKMVAEAICMEMGKTLLVVDSKSLKGAEPVEVLKIIIRESLLQRSALYLEGFDVMLQKDAGVNLTNLTNLTNLIRELDHFPGWVFLSGELPCEPGSILENHSFANLAMPLPSFVLRKKLWESFLNGSVSEDVDIGALAGKFKFSGGQIKDAIFTARNLAMTKKLGGSTLSMEDLYQGCKAQSNMNLSAFAKKIEPHYTWEDLVLPKDIKEQLKEVSGYIKYKGTVYADWGFDKKLSLGKGLNVLFSGPSGTGKTMAAEIIAGNSKLSLYKIDLSCVVSKYIGETEKNLQNIFKEAETSNSILFFDEADALFGKRSEVKDAHDRYANIEVNYLLQKMEEYEGIVIMASNFKKNIDEAFLRRIHFTIEFPVPDEKLREKIWKNIFPKETPVADDLDFCFLSRLKITGGNIKNIVLSAAFLAAGDSGVVRMEHIIKATRREFQKIGKLCSKGDFGEYYKLIEEGMRNE
ncbi:MAG: ATP-binding protein [Candidatus Methanoperedens sp.]